MRTIRQLSVDDQVMNAKRTSSMMTRNPRPEDGLTCRDCAHARDFHDRSFRDGHFILCGCDLQEHCMLLNHDRCDNFTKKED